MTISGRLATPVALGALALLPIALLPAAPAAATPVGTVRVSVGISGEQADGASRDPFVGASGQWLAFTSTSTTLEGRCADPRILSAVYWHDVPSGRSECISLDADLTPFLGARAVGIGRSGLDVLFTTLEGDVLLYDRFRRGSEPVLFHGAPIGTRLGDPALSADARYVAFRQDPRKVPNTFVLDRVTGKVSAAPTTARAPFLCLNGDGRYLFHYGELPGSTSGAVVLLRYDRLSGEVRQAAPGVFDRELSADALRPAGLSCSKDGRTAVFATARAMVPGDTNGVRDVYAATVKASGSSLRVVSRSTAAQADAESYDGAISPDGKYVVFSSRASNLAPTRDTNGFADVYARNLLTGITWRVDRSPTGAQPNRPVNGRSAITTAPSGHAVIVYATEASNLVPGDTNGTSDVFQTSRG